MLRLTQSPHFSLPHCYITHPHLLFPPPCYTKLRRWWPYPPPFLSAHPHFPFAPPCYTTPYMSTLWFALSPHFPLPHPHITPPNPHFPFLYPFYTILHKAMLCKAILCFILCPPSFPPPQPCFPFPPPCCAILYMAMLCYSPRIGLFFQSSINCWHGSLVGHLPAKQKAWVQFPLQPSYHSCDISIKDSNKSSSVLQLKHTDLVVRNVN